ncbi:glycosyltransferase [Polymorphobacter multimanifer]|nr:glycosyltransferase [Polymorphobacter multimanifer]
MRLVQSVDSLAEKHGGPSRAIVMLAEAQARAGSDVQLIARAEADKPYAPDPALVPLTLAQGFAERCRHTAALLRSEAPSLLHDNGLWLPANLAATATARRLGRPHVISPHGMLAPWALAWRPWRKRIASALFQQSLLESAAGLVAAAEPERSHIRARLPRARIATIANGVNIPASLPARAPQPMRTLLFMSRLHPVKNLPALIAAWGRIIADPTFDAWRLHIAGPDEDGHRAELAPLVTALGQHPRITFTGPVSEADKVATYAAADLFILPSLSENFGIVVAEALAHGLPAITTHATPWSDLPREGAGFHGAPDAASLEAMLRQALACPPAELIAMGARGRALVERRFGWPRIAAQSLAFYEWLLHGGPTPDFVEA